MNIACDARALVGPLTGVGRWTVEVMAGLAGRFGHDVLLAASKPFEPPAPLHRAGVRRIAPPAAGWPGTLWLHSALPRALEREEADVFVASLAIVPRRCPVPAVAVVHDITPRTHPHRHTLANRFCFNAYLEESLERAVAVVADSAATEAALRETFPSVRHRLHRIPLGVGTEFGPAPDDDDGERVRERFTGGRRYVLHLGTLEPRKGVVDLIQAWERLDEQDPGKVDLVLAGAKGWGYGPIADRLASSGERARIHSPGYVSDEDAVELLRHADVFVIASEAEGWGLPLAEAIACGTPCVATDIPALREVAADAALFVPPSDSEALATAIGRALAPDTSRGLRERARRRSADLRWEPVVDRWNELLSAVVG